MKRIVIIFLVVMGLLLPSCTNDVPKLNIHKVGMLVEVSVNDHLWNAKGYKGLLAIQDKFDVKVIVKEDIVTRQDTIRAVEELVRDGANLIFGHSSSYGKYFIEISQDFPKVQFVYFNGGYFAENVTSLNFNSHAMGFFAGMIASKMTRTNHVGIIAAYEWQPEVEGFFEGAKFQNPMTKVDINYVDSWNATDAALEMYKKMRKESADVFYPTGDSYSSDIIKLAADEGIYAIGYVSDQSNIDPSIVLTSTIQDVDKVYLHIAEKFNNKELKGGIETFDFKDGFISLGKFSPEVPEEFQMTIYKLIDEYMKSNILPHEM